MLTITKIPPKLSFSKNPILFELYSDLFVKQIGTYYLYNFLDVTSFVDGDTLTFKCDNSNWEAKEFVYTYKDTPTNPNEFSDNIELFLLLENNYYIFNNYNLFVGFLIIGISAKEKGNIYNLEIYHNTTLHPPTLYEFLGTDYAENTDLSVEAQVFDRSNDNLIGTMELKSVNNGISIISPNGYLSDIGYF